MKYLLMLLLSLTTLTVLAQREDHLHYEKYIGEVEAIETDELRIEIIRPHSQESHLHPIQQVVLPHKPAFT